MYGIKFHAIKCILNNKILAFRKISLNVHTKLIAGKIVSVFKIREYDARSLTTQAVAFYNGTLSRGTELDRLYVVARLCRKSRTQVTPWITRKMAAWKCR